MYALRRSKFFLRLRALAIHSLLDVAHAIVGAPRRFRDALLGAVHIRALLLLEAASVLAVATGERIDLSAVRLHDAVELALVTVAE